MPVMVSECSRSDLEHLDSGIVAYNASMVPFTQSDPFIRLNFKVEVDGNMVAGIQSVLYCWGCLYLDVLLVDHDQRGRGYGTMLLNRVEEEASKHGCHLIHLDTFDFQAKDYYLRRGFEVFGVLPNCPKNHTRYYLKKDLQCPDSPSR
jgi:GNAT superfamily N-acetyltransferase